MSARLAILAGLVSGVVAAGALLAAAVALVPDPGAPSPRPSVQTGVSSPTAPASTAGATSAPTASGPATPEASATPAASTDPGRAFHVGEPAPELDVPQVGGGRISLDALRGQPVWVNFMATWCPSCVDEFPLMNGFAARYADAGLVVLAVDVREDEGTVAAFAESLDTAFPVGLDADGAAQRRWGADALPVHFWIDAEGIVRDGALGGIGPDVMARGLRAILPGVEVAP